eukprot:1136169-Pelagomonas_calceolata.AAC.2
MHAHTDTCAARTERVCGWPSNLHGSMHTRLNSCRCWLEHLVKLARNVTGTGGLHLIKQVCQACGQVVWLLFRWRPGFPGLVCIVWPGVVRFAVKWSGCCEADGLISLACIVWPAIVRPVVKSGLAAVKLTAGGQVGRLLAGSLAPGQHPSLHKKPAACLFTLCAQISRPLKLAIL